MSTNPKQTKSTRLIPLSEAIKRVAVSRTKYHRNKSVLPEPVRQGVMLFFFEDEVDAHIEKMRRERDERLKQGRDKAGGNGVGAP